MGPERPSRLHDLPLPPPRFGRFTWFSAGAGWVACVALLLATAAMARAAGITYVGRVASGTASTSSTSLTIKTTGAVPAGDALIVSVLLSSVSTSTVTVTDAAGNAYVQERDQTSGAGDRLLVFASFNIKALASAANIVITHPTSAECHASVDEFGGIASLDRSASAFATSTSFNSGLSGTLAQPNELVFGVVGEESGAVPAFASGWTALPTLSISTDRLTSAYRVATAGGSFAASGTASGTWMAAVLTYLPSAPPPDLAPVASLAVTNLAPPSLDVSADGSGSTDTDVTPIATYQFDFGDGSPLVVTNAPTATHSYTSGGTYTITLTAIDGASQASTPVSKTITVVQDLPPAASLAVTNPNPPSLAVIADGAGSTDTDGSPIKTFTFDFGDGSSPVTINAPVTTANHNYPAGATYTVTLVATDTHGNASSPVTQDVTVTEPPDLAPVASLSVTNLSPPSLDVSADGAGSTDTDVTPIAHYQFDFGDGSSVVTIDAPATSATHTYAAGGTYTVTLIAIDSANQLSTPVTQDVTVVQDLAPVASLAVSNPNPPSLAVIADAAGSTDSDGSPIKTYAFDFGDGSPLVTINAPATSANHTYAAGGTYTVTLVATDTHDNASAPVTQSVTVVAPPNQAPVASLALTNVGAPSLVVSADGSGSTDTDAFPIAQYQFDFGDGSSLVTTNAPTASATHTYASPGTYTVTLVAIDSGSLSSNPASRTIVVTSAPKYVGRVASTTTSSSSSSRTLTAGRSVAAGDAILVSVMLSSTSSSTVTVTDLAGNTYHLDRQQTSSSDRTLLFSALNAKPLALGQTLTVKYPTAVSCHIAVDEFSGIQALDRTISATQTASSFSSGSTGTLSQPIELLFGVVGVQSGSSPSWSSPLTALPALSISTDRLGEAYRVTSATSSTSAGGSCGGTWMALAATYTSGPPPDFAPVASLAVTNLNAPSLDVSADGAASTDTDATPVAHYQFDFGDGSAPVTVNAPTTSAPHSYATPGTYIVTLTAVDGANQFSNPVTKSVTVALDQAPAAGLVVTNPNPPSLTVTASGATSTDIDTPIQSYRFDFGDGSPAVTVTAPATSANHDYASGGTYTVTLIATDTHALASTPVTKDITVVPDQPPVASLAVTNPNPPSLKVTGDAAGSIDSDTPIQSYRFDFGDGTAAVTVNMPATTSNHTYAAANTYTVTLTATDTHGVASAPVTQSITVVAPPDQAPVAALTLTNLNPPSLQVVADGGTSTDTDATPIATYQFDFGDGSPVAVINAPATSTTHVYASGGTYTVTLTATDTGNNPSTPVTQTVTVAPSPPRYVARIGSTTLTTSSTSATITAAADVIGGDGILVEVLLNSTGTTTVSVTDDAGNTYHLDREQNDGTAHDRTFLFSALLAKPLAAGQSIHVTYPSAATCEVIADEFSGIRALDRVAGATATTSAFNSGNTATTTQPVELILGVVGIESGSAPTWGSGLTGLAALAIGSDRLGAGYRVSSATGVFAATGTSSGTWMAIVATYTSGPPPEAPPQAALFVTPDPYPSLKVTADGSPSTDVDATPIQFYQFDFGDGTPTVQVNDPNTTAPHTYAHSGTYTVRLIATDTGGHASAPASATVTVPTTAPIDNPPTAVLAVSQASSPALTVIADGSASTDTDTTPIASYTFDFGDGTAVVTKTAPTATATHTYAAAGTYTVTLTAKDTGGKVSSAVTQTITESGGVTTGSVAVYVGYYDTHHGSRTQPKPSPWVGGTNVTFVGVPDAGTTNSWDSSAIRVDNLTSSTQSILVSVDMGSKHFGLWSAVSVPAGKILILAQTSTQNFDGSDTNPAGCYGCDPTLCTTKIMSTIPVVHVTVGGKLGDYYDSGQVLNTKGADGAGCPYTGTRNDESHNWAQVFPKAGALAMKPVVNPEPRVWLAPPAPNPSLGVVTLRFVTPRSGKVSLGIYDVAGRLLHTVVNATLEPGDYASQVDLTGVRAGVYFCRLITSEGIQRERFVLAR